MPVLASFCCFHLRKYGASDSCCCIVQSELQYSRTQQKGCASCAASQQTALFGVFFNGSSLLQGRHHSGDQNQLYDNARHGIE